MTGFILSPYHSKELSNYWELAWKLYHILGPGTNKKSSIVRNVTYFQKYRVIYLYVSRLKSYDFNLFKRQFQSRHSVKHFNGFLLPLVWNVISLAWNSRSFTMGPLLMSPASCQAFASCRFFYLSMWLYHSPHLWGVAIDSSFWIAATLKSEGLKSRTCAAPLRASFLRSAWRGAH